jgi:signal transduction histidine kinase
MVTSNVSSVVMLLAISLWVLSFQLWRNSRLKSQMRLSRAQVDHDEFSIASSIIEHERSRISSELHDELGTLLSIIYLDLELVAHEAASLTPQAENRLIDIKRNLNLVIESIRNNIWNLSAQMFDKVDLGFVVRELCHKLDRYKGTHVTFVQSGAPFKIDDESKLNLFRIVQELLTNSIKHSSAWNISVHLHWDEQSLSITLEDDGVSYTETKGTDGLGILNISRRIDYIGATMTRKNLDKGHRIILSFKIS